MPKLIGAADRYAYASPPRFFDVEYAIDANIIKGREKVTMRFEATEGNSIASVFGIRMIRGETD